MKIFKFEVWSDFALEVLSNFALRRTFFKGAPLGGRRKDLRTTAPGGPAEEEAPAAAAAAAAAVSGRDATAPAAAGWPEIRSA